RRRELVEPLRVDVATFTQDHGPQPAKAISLYCRGCNTRYYYSYYLYGAARTYYREVRQYTQAVEHVYVDDKTCAMFSSMMVNSWCLPLLRTSATNCARIYKASIVEIHPFRSLLPVNYSTRLTLDTELVWNAVLMYWLQNDHRECGTTLELNHDVPSHAVRISQGLKRRNDRYVGTGQPEWNHGCEVCCWITVDESGDPQYVRSVVVDGVTVGRPCCGKPDCDNPLATVNSRHCSEHEGMNYICCLDICGDLAETGFRTCANPDHRAFETHLLEEAKSVFQLKRRRDRERKSAPVNHPPLDAGDESEDENGSDSCEGKPEGGNRTLKARFGRRRTHNEELCVASCGVILGRATMYGSEAPNGVITFLKALFPTQRSLPQVIWHDNNCRIYAMLENSPEDKEYFAFVALPVDVFHFKAKHKESDTQCNAHCNASNWPDLMTKDNKWRFNSSAAEQTNGWFGKYASIVREMEAIRYDFFLDEMIKQRNSARVQELEAKGKRPFQFSRADLLRVD
ncbi:hypothetical protein DFP72DRAFT_829566, partial [Ephemerocybe angulata]